MRLTRSRLAAIDQELLDFCLIKVPKFQYNFETLEAHVLNLTLERKFSSFIAVDKNIFENLVSIFFQNDVHLVNIRKIMENNHPILTQYVMLPSNSNKSVKESFVKKLSEKKKTSAKLPRTFVDKKVAAKKIMSRKVSRKRKVQKKLKSKKDIFVPVSASASSNLRRQWLFDLKKSSLVVLKAE